MCPLTDLSPCLSLGSFASWGHPAKGKDPASFPVCEDSQLLLGRASWPTRPAPDATHQEEASGQRGCRLGRGALADPLEEASPFQGPGGQPDLPLADRPHTQHTGGEAEPVTSDSSTGKKEGTRVTSHSW